MSILNMIEWSKERIFRVLLCCLDSIASLSNPLVVVTTSVRICACGVRAVNVHACVSVRIWLDWAITYTFMHGFLNNLAQFFPFASKSAIKNNCSGRLKVKV